MDTGRASTLSEQMPDGAKSFFVSQRFLQYCLTAEYGIFPAAIVTVKSDLGITDFEVGLMGTLAYLGATVSSLAAGPLLNRFEAASVLRLSIVFSMIGLLASAMAPSKAALFAARLWSGMAGGPWYVYFPVWVDAYAPRGSETTWMGTHIALGVLANLLSYGVTATLVYHYECSWRWAFIYLAFGDLMWFAFSWQIPSRLWPVTWPRPLGERGSSAWTSRPFWLLTLTLCCGLFTLAAAEYYTLPRLTNLGESVGRAAQSYFTIGIIGCILGLGLGAFVADQVGGYRSRRAGMLFCLVCEICALPALPWTLQPEGDSVTFLFAAGFVTTMNAAGVPCLMGLALSSVPSRERTNASALLGSLTDILAFALAPAAVGAAVNELGIERGYNVGWFPICAMPALMLLAIAAEPTAESEPLMGTNAGDTAGGLGAKDPGDKA